MQLSPLTVQSPDRHPLFFLTLALVIVMNILSVSSSTRASAMPDIGHFTLQNGMEVVVIPDHRAPIVTHMVWYRAGSADEPPGVTGIAHFLEHLMFKGTDKIGPGEFSKIVARHGGEDNAFTSQDATAYFQRVAKNKLELVMSMEADRMANLRLDEDQVKTELNVVLEERRSRIENDPASILQEQSLAALYVSHPYGHPIIGWPTDLKHLDREDALSFYRQFYAPNNAILVVAGDVTPEEVRALAEKTYGQIPARDGVKAKQRPAEPEPSAQRRVILQDARAGKPTLYRFYLTPSYPTAGPGEAEALDVLMRIIGHNPTGRLYQELVVKRKLAAAAAGWYSGYGRDSGRIGLYAIAADGVFLEDIEKAIDEVLAQIVSEGVTEKELERARNAEIADLIYKLDSQTSMARTYGFGLAIGRTVEDIESHSDRLAAVTLEDIKKVVHKYLQAKRSVTGFLLPSKQALADTSSTPPPALGGASEETRH